MGGTGRRVRERGYKIKGAGEQDASYDCLYEFEATPKLFAIRMRTTFESTWWFDLKFHMIPKKTSEQLLCKYQVLTFSTFCCRGQKPAMRERDHKIKNT